MKVLITGASGLYGSKLSQIMAKNCEVYSGYSKHKPVYGVPIKFDISNKNRVEQTFKKINADVVVHAAALTHVDKCEAKKELAWKINVVGTRNVVEAVKACDAFMIYISTDYVFNGEKGNYIETDQLDPINYYGLTKLKAEELVKDRIDKYCIARTSVIYGASSATEKVNFALWLLNKFRKKEPAHVVVDQWNSPTLNTNLAEMTWEIIQRKLTGVYHLAGATRISRYNFARLMASAFNIDPTIIIPSISSNFSWVARRPKDSSLNIEKAQEALRNKPMKIDQALSQLRNDVNYG